MSKIEKFEDLESWKKGRTIANRIYEITEEQEFERDYSLIDQIRRSVISIMSNIAEGFARESGKEFIRFLFIAKSSAAEAQSQLYIAKDREYIDPQEFEEIYEMLDHCSRLLSNHIKYLKRNQRD